MISILKIILIILLFWITDKINGIFYSRAYARKCNYNCEKCEMWNCTHETNYKNYRIPPYDDFYNVCGKEKRECMKK